MIEQYNRYQNVGEIAQAIKVIARDIDKALSENKIEDLDKFARELIDTSSRLRGWVLEQRK